MSTDRYATAGGIRVHRTIEAIPIENAIEPVIRESRATSTCRARCGRRSSAGSPTFGVCLGLQGMVEHWGGTLGVLDYPMHGKASRIHVRGGRLFEGLPKEFTAGRYHSLFAVRETLPAEFEVTAETDDGIVMAVEHARLPLAAVQFYPESIMSLDADVGLRLLHHVVTRLASAP